MDVANHPLAKTKTVTACRQIAAGDFLALACAGLKVSDRRNVVAFSRASIRAGEGGNPFLRAINTDAVHQDIATRAQ